MKQLKHILLNSLVLFGLTFALVPALAPAAVYADSKSTACAAIGGCTSGANGSTDINTLVKTIINVLSVVVGVTAVVMIIVAGSKFISSSGDSGKIAGARSTLIYALVGLFIVGIAQVLVHFVLAKAGGVK